MRRIGVDGRNYSPSEGRTRCLQGQQFLFGENVIPGRWQCGWAYEVAIFMLYLEGGTFFTVKLFVYWV